MPASMVARSPRLRDRLGRAAVERDPQMVISDVEARLLCYSSLDRREAWKALTILPWAFGKGAEKPTRRSCKHSKATPLRAHGCRMPDAIDHPEHYGGGDNPYEAIKVVEAWGLDFHLGNVVKYISRAGKKGDILEDLKKARWYLDRAISNLERAKAK
jgi:hypothetical protein